MKTFDETANKVADVIKERGYEFGTGRFRDVELVLEIAHALGVLKTKEPTIGVLQDNPLCGGIDQITF